MSVLHAFLKRCSLVDLGSVELSITAFYGFLFAAGIAGAAIGLLIGTAL